MRNDDLYKIGKNEADIANLQHDGEDMDDRVGKIEDYISVQKLAIAKCTALWGFIIASATAIGGFIAYNFVKVKLAIIAAYTAFYDGH